MQASTLMIIVIALCIAGYYFGYRRSVTVSRDTGGIKSLHSLPTYYGTWTALWCAIPAMAVLLAWSLFETPILNKLLIQDLPAEYQELHPNELKLAINNIKNLAAGSVVTDDSEVMQQAAARYSRLNNISSWALLALALSFAVAAATLAWSKIQPELRARNKVEKIVRFFLISCSSLAILTTVGIVFSVLFESIQFFRKIPFTEFMFGTHWSPQSAFHGDATASFGAIPLFVGTLLISFIALLIAVPIGLMSAIYLSEYASYKFRSIAKPTLEILAGVPTVVYGFFAVVTVAPAIRGIGESIGLTVASESALAAGLVMGVMIIPFVSSLSDDVINAVPQSLRDGSLGMGATKSETIRQVIIPAALPGIVGGVLLAASRAIGETMIVVMAAGLSANLTINPLEAVTTVTVQIVTLLVGDQEFDSAKTLAAFALGLMLFVTTLILNVIALRVVRKYREQYD